MELITSLSSALLLLSVLCYLKGTRAYALVYGGADDFEIASDALFGDNTQDRKSLHTYVMKLFGGLIGGRASKQTTATKSTTEAELLSLSQAAQESEFMDRLLKELKVYPEPRGIHIQCDNLQTVRIVNSEIAQFRTSLRHVDIHNHWLRQEVTQGRIAVSHVPTQKMMADGLTKALAKTKHQTFVKMVELQDITARLAKRELKDIADFDGQDDDD
jgi:hypothetical protein